ncbi:MAG: prephenate/arogenate dehydrogenase family protein [Pseudomonadota bacterium]
MTDTPLFEHAVVVGIGLIGSSMAHAMRERGLARKITGCDADDAVRARAQEIGIVDAVSADIKKAAKGADLIIIATPVQAAADMIRDIAGASDPGTLIVDVGSVKGAFAGKARALQTHAHIVPCHPVAGTEQSGPDSGFASLFENRWCIVTPLERDAPGYRAAIDKAIALWKAVGAQVEVMDAGHHDIALAITSHLPHLLAFTLVGAADDLETVTQSEIIKYSAGGFRDFTRIAASDPTMWRDVFLTNKDAVLEVLGRFTEELAVLQRAIRWADADTLEDVFSRGRNIRRAIIQSGQETDAPNFGRDKENR